jgi:uncharacterized protein (DUF2235 family)
VKRLVLCLDGTWNRADQQENHEPCPTNVLQVAIRSAKRDGDVVQVIYYDQGVGTGNVLDRFSGGAFGDGLEDNIHDAYRFLLANYEAGDQIFLFGFSRGAFTARSVAGMVRKCGILRRGAMAQYRNALAMYRGDQRPADAGPTEFRTTHSICGAETIPIHFLGVWDTVGALGIPLRGLRWITRRRHQFHDVELSSAVRRAYHALAIDEHRAPFKPTLWSEQPKEGQVVEQTWFCGAHSDVGGGYAARGLSDIALEWMLGKAREAGLALEPETAAAYPLRPDHLAQRHNSSRGVYRLLPGLDRTIGVAVTTAGDLAAGEPLDSRQSLHHSVLRRWDEDPSYRPDALRAFFRRVGDPRAST